MKGLMKSCSGGSPMWREWRGVLLLRVYVREFAGSRSVGRTQKRWLDTVKECLKKIGLDVKQAMRMVQDRREWWGFVRGNEALEGWKSVCGRAYNLKGIKGNIFYFSSLP